MALLGQRLQQTFGFLSLTLFVFHLQLPLCHALPNPSLSIIRRNLNALSERAASKDPSCPAGFLCDQQNCPAGIKLLAATAAYAVPVPPAPPASSLTTTSSGISSATVPLVTSSVTATSAISSTTASSTKPTATSMPTLITTNRASSDISSTSTATSTPTVVPSVGLYVNTGCFTDSFSARVLVAGNKTDQSATGMTVEKCVSFAEDGGWRYAGVEYGGECHVGNTLHHATKASPGDCNQKCAGNQAEYCGSGNRIQIYADSSWSFPNQKEIRDVLLTFNSTLYDIVKATNVYWSDLQQLQTYQSQSSKAKRDLVSLLAQVTADGVTLVRSTNTFRVAAAAAQRIFRIAQAEDLEDQIPLLTKEERAQIDNAAQQGTDVMEQLKTLAGAVSDAIAKDVWRAFNLAKGLATLDSTALIVGIPIAIGGVGVATGIYIVGGIELPPHTSTIPTSTTAISSSTSTTSSATTCVPTLGPTPMVILAASGLPVAAVDSLIKSLPKGSVTDQSSYPDIGYNAILAEIDNCNAEDLIANSDVVAVSLNAEVPDPVDDIHEGHVAGTLDFSNSTSARHSNPPTTTKGLEKRAQPSDSKLRFEAGYQWNYHLRWLSAPWANNADPDAGPRRNFDGFLWDNAPAGDKSNQVYIYVMDSGITGNHYEFDEAPSTLNKFYNARTGETSRRGVSDSDGHGSRMASSAAGNFFGVAKNAKLNIVKVVGFTDERTTVWELMKGYAWACNDVKKEQLKGRAVLSMSIGESNYQLLFSIRDSDIISAAFELNTLYWKPNRKFDESGKQNPFLWIFDDYIYPHGIVAVAAGHNKVDEDLAAFEPQARGGNDAPLIVVGNANHDGERYVGEGGRGSSIIDSSGKGILSVYAMGEKICGAVTRGAYNKFLCTTGCSPAAAQVAGLSAYYLAKPSIRARMLDDTNGPVSLNVKNLLRDIGLKKKGKMGGDGLPRVAIDEWVDCETSEGPASKPEWISPGDGEPYDFSDPAVFGDGDGDIIEERLVHVEVSNDGKIVLDDLPKCVNI
ncbi:hypothetical protein BGZ63DRAFT_409575 [Mariannaea sp. PMI_226]|nr:hypothetical protein BGZ63DRAFT_409575 [Mariannaea sp. PMI_226]